MGEIAVVEPNAAAIDDLPREIVRAATLGEGLAWKPDVVFIASPSELHVAQALEAARSGCHVFIEKPLSHTRAAIDELAGEVAHRQLRSLVGCNMRFHPGPAKVKQLLEEDAVGQVVAARLKTGSYLPGWRPDTDYRKSYSASRDSGGAILDCIHEIDLACWMFGPARLVAARHHPATTLGLETDGLAEMLLDHDSGILSSVHLNFIQRDYRRTCEVVGSEGTIHWDFQERTVRVYRESAGVAETFAQPADWEVNRMYVDEVAHFLDCVREGKETCNPVAQAAAVLEIALSARQESNASRS